MPLDVYMADKVADFSLILEGARHFARQVDFAEWLPKPFEGEKFTAAVRRIVELEAVHIVLCSMSGPEMAPRVMGGFGFLLSPYLWNPELVCAEELFWWAHPQAPANVALRCLLAFRAAAKEGGANLVVTGALATSPARVRKIYESMGMKAIQVSFVGRV